MQYAYHVLLVIQKGHAAFLATYHHILTLISTIH